MKIRQRSEFLLPYAYEKATYSKKVRDLVEKIVSVYSPEEVILFGSFAWGKPSRESDIDLLVVKRTQKKRSEREQELRARLYPLKTAVDFMVYTPAELKCTVEKNQNLFFKDILANGVIVYEKNKIR